MRMVLDPLQKIHTNEDTQVASTKEKKNIKDSHKVLLILQPTLSPPEGVVDDFITITMTSPGGRIVYIHSGAHTL